MITTERYNLYFASEWHDLRRLPGRSRELVFYVRTGPPATAIPGVAAGIGPAGIAEDLGWSGAEDVYAAVRDIQNAGYPLRVDFEHRVYWSPLEIPRQPPASPAAVRTWSRVWPQIEACAIKAEMREFIRSVCAPHLGAKINRDSFLPTDFDLLFPPVETPGQPPGSPLPSPLSRQDQDQGQVHKQVQGQEHEQCGAPGGASPQGVLLPGVEVGKAKKAKKPRATTIENDAWKPSEFAIAKCAQLGLDLEAQETKYRAHRLHKRWSVAKWDADFIAWLAQSAEWAKKSPTKTGSAVGHAMPKREHGIGEEGF